MELRSSQLNADILFAAAEETNPVVNNIKFDVVQLFPHLVRLGLRPTVGFGFIALGTINTQSVHCCTYYYY